jgi:hypothetical protein
MVGERLRHERILDWGAVSSTVSFHWPRIRHPFEVVERPSLGDSTRHPSAVLGRSISRRRLTFPSGRMGPGRAARGPCRGTRRGLFRA